MAKNQARCVPWDGPVYADNPHATARVLSAQGYNAHQIRDKLLDSNRYNLDRSRPYDLGFATRLGVNAGVATGRHSDYYLDNPGVDARIPLSQYLSMELATEYLYLGRLTYTDPDTGERQYRDIPVYTNERMNRGQIEDAVRDLYQQMVDRCDSMAMPGDPANHAFSVLIYGRNR